MQPVTAVLAARVRAIGASSASASSGSSSDTCQSAGAVVAVGCYDGLQAMWTNEGCRGDFLCNGVPIDCDSNKPGSGEPLSDSTVRNPGLFNCSCSGPDSRPGGLAVAETAASVIAVWQWNRKTQLFSGSGQNQKLNLSGAQVPEP